MIDWLVNGVLCASTAYPLCNGDSEPFVGRVLKKYNRESFRLATKLPHNSWNIYSQEAGGL